MNQPLSRDTLLALGQLATPSVSNAIEQFKVRLRNEGFADSTVRCLFPNLGPIVGYAVTAKIRCSGPPVDTHAILERNDWWETIRAVPAPRVFVVQDVDAKPGSGALLGEVHANILMAMGCVGAVTNGAVRDLAAVSEMGFHFFAASPAVSHSYAHIIEVGTPVEIGGLRVQQGDLLHGDAHGVLAIPLEIAAEISSMAERLLEREKKLIDLCRSNNFSLERLRQAVKEGS